MTIHSFQKVIRLSKQALQAGTRTVELTFQNQSIKSSHMFAISLVRLYLFREPMTRLASCSFIPWSDSVLRGTNTKWNRDGRTAQPARWAQEQPPGVFLHTSLGLRVIRRHQGRLWGRFFSVFCVTLRDWNLPGAKPQPQQWSLCVWGGPLSLSHNKPKLC